MGDSGGTAEITLLCARDGAPTRLRCAECQDPICPACYVRTPVGLRCPACAVASGPPRRDDEAGGRPRWLAPVLVAVAITVALAGAIWVGGRNGGGGPGVDPEFTQGPVAERVRIGTGDLPRGSWILEARRGDGICATLTLVPGPPSQESCHGLPGNRHISFTRTSRLTTPSETIFLTVGVISERTERVLVTPEGEAPWEVPALGAGMNLGGRFFVAHTTSPVTTFTAMGDGGAVLGSIRSAPPGT